VVLGLYSLDQQLATARTHLASLQSQLAGLRARQAVLQQATAIARHATTLAQRHLGRRLQLLYERGEVEPLEILFGARSLDEALNSIESLKGVTKQDTLVLREVTGARESFMRDRLRLAFRTSEVAAAATQAAQTTASLEQTLAQRHAYITSLTTQRRLNDRQIAALVVRAHAAQTRSVALARTPTSPVSFTSGTTTAPPTASATFSSATSGRTLTVVATAYALSGTTSTGLPVGWGVAAVDPSVIPLGTHMSVPGYGDAVAADTGGAVVGSTIDLWFPTVAQANAWGRRVVTITLR
jgi:3D (Asp-Asp-Asp) domain-containing protein